MAEKKFTFIELHLDGETQFGPKAIGDALPIGGPVEDEAATETETEDEDDAAGTAAGGKGTALGVIVGLLGLVAVAAAVKKFRGEDGDLEHEEEPEIIVN